MSAAFDPRGPADPSGTPQISEAAQVARERLQEEIERVRSGVEEMLAEQRTRGGSAGVDAEALRRELEQLRLETRAYVKRRVRKSTRKLRRAIDQIDARTDLLERRIDEVEADRARAEWRIHANTEAMLDGLLRDVREIADLLTRQ
jgi:ElaB/YqjD/DUF883 family membrane-anchored ribosome-binding protein